MSKIEKLEISEEKMWDGVEREKASPPPDKLAFLAKYKEKLENLIECCKE